MIRYTAIIATIERKLPILIYLYFILNLRSNNRGQNSTCSPLTSVQALAKNHFYSSHGRWEIEKKRENVGVIGCCKRQIDHATWFSPMLFLLAIEESQTSTCLEVT